MRLQAVMLAIALSIAAAASVRGPEVGGLEAYEMPAYTLVAADPGAAQAAARAAAQSDTLLAKLLGRANAGRNAPTVLFIVPAPVWSRYLSPGNGIYGQFVPAPFANYIEVSSNSDSIERRVMHEYAHSFLHTQFRGLVPLWFDEGVAQFVEPATFKQGVATLGMMIGWPKYAPNSLFMWTGPNGHGHDWMPIPQLLGLDGRSRIYRDSYRNFTVHQQAWLMVHSGLAADPATFGRKMFAMLDAQDELVPPQAAIRQSFGVSPGDFDLQVRSYLKGDFAPLELAVGPVTVPEIPARRELPALETLDLVAELMIASGRLERFNEILDAMERVAPESAAANAWSMRLAARQGAGAALNRVVDVLDADSDPRLLRAAGLALFERALAAKADKRPDKALQLLHLVMDSRPDDAEAAWAYATLAAGLKRDLPLAQTRIEAMRAAWPGNADLAMAATQVYEALGETEKARQALQDTRRLAKRPEMIRWAKDRLEK